VRKELLLLTGLALAAAAVIAGATAERYVHQRVVRGRFINQRHCSWIKNGMRHGEVEAVLGGPPGDFRTEPVWYPGGFLLGVEAKNRCGDQGKIQVDFDAEGCVVATYFYGPEHGPPRGCSVWDWIQIIRESGRP
jgi:outer membrane protein assembly factor BamE (lipoprotein component of BamABCDE complex)